MKRTQNFEEYEEGERLRGLRKKSTLEQILNQGPSDNHYETFGHHKYIENDTFEKEKSNELHENTNKSHDQVYKQKMMDSFKTHISIKSNKNRQNLAQ